MYYKIQNHNNFLALFLSLNFIYLSYKPMAFHNVHAFVSLRSIGIHSSLIFVLKFSTLQNLVFKIPRLHSSSPSIFNFFILAYALMTRYICIIIILLDGQKFYTFSANSMVWVKYLTNLLHYLTSFSHADLF